MREKLIRNANELSASIQDNFYLVQNTLLDNRCYVDSALVISAAKYNKALGLLADE